MSPKKDNPLADNLSIEQSLKQIANCLAYLAINSGEVKDKSRPEGMALLESLGFDRQGIASIFQTSPDVVKQSLYLLRSSKKTARAKKADGSSDGEKTEGVLDGGN
jgi:hypothetical protein